MGTRKAVEVTEPEVIDIPLIEDCIVVTSGEEMAKISKTIPFDEVEWLKLSFKNIVRIENLMGLTKLTKLQLDNNHIKFIENLDHLQNLTWLDLSFNQIEKIEGLESLVKVTDLCLTHNKIGHVEGIDTLVNLEILSLANNEIKGVDELTPLRKFEKLRVVNFQNNPVAMDAEYHHVLLAFLKHLKYLDFRLVDASKVQTAKEQYFSDLQQLQQEEAEEDKKKKNAEEEASTIARHQAANMPGVGKLFSTMLAEDMEGEKLTLFSDFEDALEDFRDQFNDEWDKFEVEMLELYEKKTGEVSKFQTMYHGAIEAVDQQSKGLVADFKLHKKKTKQRMMSPDFQARAVDVVTKEKKELINDLRTRSQRLREQLLELEMFQIEQYEDLIGQFEEKYGFLKSATNDALRLFFEKMREFQNEYQEKVKEKASDLLAKYAGGETMGLSDEALQVLADKDAFMTGVVNGSHEFRLSKIDQKDEELAKNEATNFAQNTEAVLNAEKERSRTRTDDVKTMIGFFEREIDELAAML